MRKSDSSADKKPSTRSSSKPAAKSSYSGDSKPYERKTSSEKPSFADKYKRADEKPTRSVGRPAFSDKPAGRSSFADKKPFPSRGEKPSYGADKPAGRSSFADKKPFAPRGERPTYGADKPREFDKKPFAPRGERPSYGADKPREFDKKPFAPRGEKPAYLADKPREFDKKPFVPRGERPTYGADKQRDFDKKPFAPRGERPSYGADKQRDFDKKAPFPKTDRPSYGADKPKDFDKKPFAPRGERPAYGADKARDFDRKAPFPKTDRPAYGSEKKYGQKTESGSRPRKGPNERKESFSPTPRYSPNKEIAQIREDKKVFRPTSYLDEPYSDKKEERKEYSKQVGLLAKPDITERGMIDKLPPKMKSKIEKAYNGPEEIRLNKYIANAGLCSRREADEFIASGQITVNGETIIEMGYKVQPNDVIKYGRKVLSRQKLTYVLLNKPKDFITTTEDPEGRRTVMDLVKNSTQERIYPIGRLDRATTGLLLLTNDGELAEKLSHPSNEIKKIYQLEIDKKITQEHFDSIMEGLELEDGKIKADDLSIISPDGMVLGIEIHSGKNRIVRRIFEHLGYEVLKLDRSTYAGLNKKDLPRGNWRYLTEKEVIRLKYLL
jgi:23S rRNA pseudouridine2605 synthase